MTILTGEKTMKPSDIVRAANAKPIVAEVVDHPAHYNQGDIECIDAIQAALTPEEFRGFCKGNVIKYNWRANAKQGLTSYRKAQWYLTRLIKFIEGSF